MVGISAMGGELDKDVEGPYFIQVCRPYWQQLNLNDAQAKKQLKAKLRQGRQRRGELSSTGPYLEELEPSEAKSGRPLSLERKMTRKCALRGAPYVMGLHVTAQILKIRDRGSARVAYDIKVNDSRQEVKT